MHRPLDNVGPMALVMLVLVPQVVSPVQPRQDEGRVRVETIQDNRSITVLHLPSCGQSGFKTMESHRSAKADTSGTAKALAADSATLTAEDYIRRRVHQEVRDVEGQLGFEVVEENLTGHAFPAYSLNSKDQTVEFPLRHNVCGRRMYGKGTADGCHGVSGGEGGGGRGGEERGCTACSTC